MLILASSVWYGAIIVAFGLSFIQSILAACVGVASSVLVGIASFAGKHGRTSTLTLSQVIFGLRGNIAPAFFSWINFMGCEVVNVITGTLALVLAGPLLVPITAVTSIHKLSRRIFSAVTGGVCIPLLLLMFTGIVLSERLPDLASSGNPVALIGSSLPPWMFCWRLPQVLLPSLY